MSFDLFDFLPNISREVDEADGSFQSFVWGFNQIWADLLTTVEAMPSNLLDPKTTPLIQDLATHRGNPFQCFNDTQLRKIADNLAYIYKRRGDTTGLVNVIRFILGLEATIEMDYSFCWQLGQTGRSELQSQSILSSRNSPFFKISVPGDTLPDEVKTQIVTLIQFMKPNFMCFVGSANIGKGPGSEVEAVVTPTTILYPCPTSFNQSTPISPVVPTGVGNSISFSATGLPPGLSIDPTTGVLSGTPTAVGSYTAVVVVKEDVGDQTVYVRMTVADAFVVGGGYDFVVWGDADRDGDGNPYSLDNLPAVGALTMPTCAPSFTAGAQDAPSEFHVHIIRYDGCTLPMALDLLQCLGNQLTSAPQAVTVLVDGVSQDINNISNLPVPDDFIISLTSSYALWLGQFQFEFLLAGMNGFIGANANTAYGTIPGTVGVSPVLCIAPSNEPYYTITTSDAPMLSENPDGTLVTPVDWNLTVNHFNGHTAEVSIQTSLQGGYVGTLNGSSNLAAGNTVAVPDSFVLELTQADPAYMPSEAEHTSGVFSISSIDANGYSFSIVYCPGTVGPAI